MHRQGWQGKGILLHGIIARLSWHAYLSFSRILHAYEALKAELLSYWKPPCTIPIHMQEIQLLFRA